MQSDNFSNNFNRILDEIGEFDIPLEIQSKLTEIINENEFEIASYQYDSLVSDAEDYAYEKHKEEKYFKDDN
jgi:hypothetical protein